MFKQIGLTIAIFSMLLASLAVAEEDPYRISLGRSSFTPPVGLIEITQPSHFLVQFYNIPSGSQLEDLAELGIDIQRYLDGNAYIAKSSKKLSHPDLARLKYIRALHAITPDMRMHSDFANSLKLQKAARRNEIMTADIRFHEDVSFNEALERLRTAGIDCQSEWFLAANRLLVTAPWSSLQQLSAADEVDNIEPALLNFKLTTWGGAKRMRVDQILRKAKYHKPDGTGVVAGITDEWTVDPNHVELAGRVTVVHDTSYIETPEDWADLNHATSVAGNLASGGIQNPLCRGSAPSAQILSFIIRFDPVNEIAYAAKNLGLRISSNSWGYSYDTEILPPVRIEYFKATDESMLKSKFGYYPNFNYASDKMVREADVLYFWAAGNESSVKILVPLEDEMGQIREPDAWHRKYPEFDMLLVNPSAKNVLGIGATHKDDVICGFSSRGPGYDGRIGPHLVASGFDMITIARDNTYGPGSGTSGSCPLAAGVAALIIDQFRKIHQSEPSSALIKAILFNSARDLGLKGPDYVYGYGMIDAQMAANTISGQEGLEETKKVRSRFVEDSLKHKEQHMYAFTVPKNKKELRITLAWNDVPGHKLINNLDLWARHGTEKKILPLTLTPNNPLAPAKPKRNKRDTAEHILIENPAAGAWEVGIHGKKVPKSRQDYALVISTGNGNAAPIHKTGGDFTIQSVYSSQGNAALPISNFRTGDPIALHALINVLENPRYPDGYYGTITGKFEGRNEAGQLVFALATSWHNLAPTSLGEYRDVVFFREEIPEVVPRGTFRVKTIITMHNGLTKIASKEYTVTISD